MQDDQRTDPHSLTLSALFFKFLGFGALAFGGPVAQIAMLRQTLVEEEGWIDKARFNRLLAVLQILPGPEAHELCVHLGMVARGRIGGLLAGLGFMLPGFVLMLVAAWAYVGWIAGNIAWAGAMVGIQIAVLGIILRSVVRIGQHIVEGPLLAVIAAAALIATFMQVPFWIVLMAGGLAYLAPDKRVRAVVVLIAVLVIGGIGTHLIGTGPRPIGVSAGAPVTLLMLFVAGLKGGLLTFGGAYTAIPYVRADTVGRGWLSDGAFLDGVALANVLPAPLVIFATFTGYLAGGFVGAAAITLGMFLPAFAFSLLFFERLEAVVERPGLQHLLSGVAAAVVGIIAATFIDLLRATEARVPDMLGAAILFVVALFAAWRVKGKWVTPALIALGGAYGWAALGQ